LKWGADIVIHSATKFLDGQGRCMGGAVVGSENLVGKDIFGVVRTCGPTMSPFNAWTFLKGLETLAVRMQAHSANAQQLAEFLEANAAVKAVHFPGLKSHPQHALAADQQSGPGAVLSFELAGGKDKAWKFIDATELVSITANLGDTRTTITHPATTTHGRLTPEQRLEAGITDGMIRIAVGLEDINDLQADLQRGFDAIK
jgi:O-succinylhomoserine sulfhydrylase